MPAFPTNRVPPPPCPSTSLPRAVRALRTQFFVGGALFATWGVQVPAIKSQYGLSEPLLALAMLASGVGALVALPQAGRLLARQPPRVVVPVCGVVAAVAIAGLLAPSRYAVLLALMLVHGIASLLFDVAINAEASEIERRAGRSLMSGFHGMFSLGGMVGAGAWSVLAPMGVTLAAHLIGASFALGWIGIVASRWMLADPATRADGPTGLSLPRGPLLLLGLLAGFGLVGEGALYDWSVLYLEQDIGAPTTVASLGYASFSAAMAAGRFGGDWVRARLEAATLLRASGIVAAIGMTLALAVPQSTAVLIGFALVGLGFANVIPVLFSAAGRIDGVSPAHGIAAVASTGYFGLMAGPPLIGFVAHGRSLSVGLALVIAFSVLVAAGAGRALKR